MLSVPAIGIDYSDEYVTNTSLFLKVHLVYENEKYMHPLNQKLPS